MKLAKKQMLTSVLGKELVWRSYKVCVDFEFFRKFVVNESVCQIFDLIYVATNHFHLAFKWTKKNIIFLMFKCFFIKDPTPAFSCFLLGRTADGQNCTRDTNGLSPLKYFQFIFCQPNVQSF